MTEDQTERDLDAAQALSDETPQPEPEPEPEPEPDDGDEPEGEPEPDETPPEPAPPESQAMMEAIGKKLDGLQAHVKKRLKDILGDETNHLVSCELCSPGNLPGWRWDMDVPAEVAAGVLRALGQHAASEHKQDPYSCTCATCDGLGMVATGSRAQSQSTIVCYDCQGRGWLPQGPQRSGAFPSAVNGAAAPESDAGPYSPPVGASEGPEPPEVATLRAQGYAVIAPIGT